MARSAITGYVDSRWAPLVERLHAVREALQDVAAPLLDVVVRLWLAQAFFTSGMLKTINWPATVFLYTAEHPVPGAAPGLAAVLGTGFELVCPLLLVIGLLTRVAALPLLAWTLFLQLTYKPLDAQIFQILLLGLLALR
ncbi:MAG TPA: DoxX family protein, partial [Rhodospirillales bacterium]|nr:DoxX family protein [Rhodospirillales bacterium]